VTDAALAIAVPLILVLAYLVSSRWWMPAITRAHERNAGRPLPSWVWVAFAVMGGIELAIGVLQLARGRSWLDRVFPLALGLVWTGMALAYRHLHRTQLPTTQR
jgi:hypothetical protein